MTASPNKRGKPEEKEADAMPMREHKIVSQERAREEMGEESLNGRVKGARHGCPRWNRVTLTFAKEKRNHLSVRALEHRRLLRSHVSSRVRLVSLDRNLGSISRLGKLDTCWETHN